jgi:hypothetical protein
MPWSEIPARIQRYLDVKPEKVEDIFLDLYNYGLFGLPASISSTEGKGKENIFRFGFMTPNVERHVARALTDSTLIALAPMFAEYCYCRESPVGVVQPTS